MHSDAVLREHKHHHHLQLGLPQPHICGSPHGQDKGIGAHCRVALVQGPTEQSVRSGKVEVKRILEETTERVMRRDQGAAGAVGRYSVM